MRADWSANVTTGARGVQPGRSANTTGGGAPDKMCGFQRLASRIATLPAAPTGPSPAARIGARSHHARSCSAFSNDSRVRKSPMHAPEESQTAPEALAPEPAVEAPQRARRAGGAVAPRCSDQRRYATGCCRADQRARTRERHRARNRRNRPAALQDAERKALLAHSPEDRSVENQFEPDRHFRRREDRRRPVRGTRNRTADVRCGRRSHRIPARIAARKSAHRAPHRPAAGEGGAAHAADRPAQAARKIADARPRATAGR